MSRRHTVPTALAVFVIALFLAIANVTSASASTSDPRPNQAWLNSQDTHARSPAQAEAWAMKHLGQRGWNQWCELFTETAYGRHAYTSAIAHFMVERAHHRIGIHAAPRGAFVFFQGSNPKVGHVEIAVGNGTYITTDTRIRIVNLAWGGKSLGWSTHPYPN